MSYIQICKNKYKRLINDGLKTIKINSCRMGQH